MTYFEAYRKLKNEAVKRFLIRIPLRPMSEL